jgi:hypothetical protein
MQEVGLSITLQQFKMKVAKVIQSWPTLLPNGVLKIVYGISSSVNNLICLFVKDLKFSKHKD